MTDIQIFENPEFGKIRTIELDGEPWFVGKDVAEALGYRNTKDALAKHVAPEDKIMGSQNATPSVTDSLGRKQWPTWINEAGVYSLAFSSKLPDAKIFTKWVTHEVLPSIRKHGAYISGQEQEDMTPEELIAKALVAAQGILDEKNKQIKKKDEQIKVMEPKARFADAVEASDTSILIGELAKILTQNGYKIGQNKLFCVLREQGYLCSKKGAMWNRPTQRAMDMGLFEIKERTITNPDGSTMTTSTTKVTGKGQSYFVNKFLQNVPARR